jgi:hypothetical protein
LLGLDLIRLHRTAAAIAADPPGTRLRPGDPAAPVLGITLDPR